MTADRLGTRGSTPTDPRATSFGFGQRRSWVFSAWWYPAVLAMAGAVHAGLAAIIGRSAEIGIVMAILGMMRTMFFVSALSIGALVLLTPLGGSLAAVPLLGMLAAAFLGTAAGFAYIGRLMKNSTRLYAKWLGR